MNLVVVFVRPNSEENNFFSTIESYNQETRKQVLASILYFFGWTIDRINVAKQVKPACKLQSSFCVTLKYFFSLQNTLLLFFQEVLSLSLYFFLLSPLSILWKKGWVAKAVSAFSSPSLFCMFPHKTQVLKSKVLTSKSAM